MGLGSRLGWRLKPIERYQYIWSPIKAIRENITYPRGLPSRAQGLGQIQVSIKYRKQGLGNNIDYEMEAGVCMVYRGCRWGKRLCLPGFLAG